MVCNTQEKRDDRIMKDPVCGSEVGDKGETLSHNGKEYKFCCASCRWAFEKNPEQFIQNES
jgi:YHS domain-containing protein